MAVPVTTALAGRGIDDATGSSFRQSVATTVPDRGRQANHSDTGGLSSYSSTWDADQWAQITATGTCFHR
jgi:hypothetical protein